MITMDSIRDTLSYMKRISDSEEMRRCPCCDGIMSIVPYARVDSGIYKLSSNMSESDLKPIVKSDNMKVVFKIVHDKTRGNCALHDFQMISEKESSNVNELLDLWNIYVNNNTSGPIAVKCAQCNDIIYSCYNNCGDLVDESYLSPETSDLYTVTGYRRADKTEYTKYFCSKGCLKFYMDNTITFIGKIERCYISTKEKTMRSKALTIPKIQPINRMVMTHDD